MTVTGFSEAALLLRIKYRCGAKPTLVDVGAHVGRVSAKFLRAGWRVFAFEPEPENRRKLDARLACYGDFVCIPKAVSDVAQRGVPFYVSTDHWGIHSLKPFHETHQPALEVETVRLDHALEELRVDEVTVLKIDVEGADFLALKSFAFERLRPQAVMCEFMDERSRKHFGYDHHDMACYLRDREYAVYVSEWAPIVEYARKDRTGEPHRFLQCVQYPLGHAPAWGNLIGIVPNLVSEFKGALARYLAELCSWNLLLRRVAHRIPGTRATYRLARRLLARG